MYELTCYVREYKREYFDEAQKIVVTVAAVIAIILIGSATWVFATNDDNVIHACYKAGGENEEEDENIGQLRLVSSAEECRRPELPIEWNIVGPVEPQGEQSPQGPAGADGAPGEQGPQGRQY
ncbi:MAG: hypothetical protein WA996_09105 [Candidatus Promineifilaceae bacterium]